MHLKHFVSVRMHYIFESIVLSMVNIKYLTFEQNIFGLTYVAEKGNKVYTQKTAVVHFKVSFFTTRWHCYTVCIKVKALKDFGCSFALYK